MVELVDTLDLKSGDFVLCGFESRSGQFSKFKRTFKMKILCLSDTHNQHPRLEILPEFDLLIYAGDATMKGRLYEYHHFGEWLNTIKQPKAVLLGNHDVNDFQHHSLIPEKKTVEILGLKIWAWSGSSFRRFPHEIPRSNGPKWWNNWADPSVQKNTFAQIPENLDILITHTPPYKILDHCPGGCVGDPELKEALNNLKKPPKLHVFGHIHESRGQMFARGTLHVNASYLDGRYQIWNKPFEIVEL